MAFPRRPPRCPRETLGPGREVLLLPGLSSASRLVEAIRLVRCQSEALARHASTLAAARRAVNQKSELNELRALVAARRKLRPKRQAQRPHRGGARVGISRLTFFYSRATTPDHTPALAYSLGFGANTLNNLAVPRGLEPPTFGLGNRRSRLNFERRCVRHATVFIAQVDVPPSDAAI